MKKIYFFITILVFLTSCATYTIETSLSGTESYGKICSNTEYISTMSFNAAITPDGFIQQNTLTVSNLLDEARRKYGNDVTITNVQWDRKGNIRKSVTFDVIKCKN